ncbi:hypothetical protein [Pseudomonas sp.]|uniref:hypothetical protein n=1 Tax=Pseudomonas sp. TaxID=306 RepID=UPI0031D4A127
MYPKIGEMPAPIVGRGTPQGLDSLDSLADAGDVNETRFNVFIGHNLGHRGFTMSVPPSSERKDGCSSTGCLESDGENYLLLEFQ